MYCIMIYFQGSLFFLIWQSLNFQTYEEFEQEKVSIQGKKPSTAYKLIIAEVVSMKHFT